jgi:hypothetical protein
MGGTSHGRQMNSTWTKELMSTGERHGDVRHVCALCIRDGLSSLDRCMTTCFPLVLQHMKHLRILE